MDRKPKKVSERTEAFLAFMREAHTFGGDLGAALASAIREFSPGRTLTDIAGRIDERRSDLSMCIHKKHGRRYDRIRRKLEDDCRIARGTLDAVIDDGKVN